MADAVGTAPAKPPGAPAPPGKDGEPKDSQAVLASAGYGMGSGLIQVVIRAATTVLTARALHAELLGLFHLSNRIAKIGSTFSLSGQDDAVVHFVARHRSTGELGKARGAFYVSVAIATALSVVMGVAVYVLAPWLSRDQFRNEQMVPIIRTFALAVPLSVLGGVGAAALQGTREVKKSLATQNVIIPFVRLALFALLLCFGLKLFGLVFALLGSLLVGLFYVGAQLRKVDWMRPGVAPVYETRSVVAFSVPLIFLSLIDYLNNSADILIVGKWMDASSVGVYGQAVRVFTILKVPISALSALFIPLCAEFYATKQMDRLRNMYRATASCGIRIAIAAVLGTILFARPVMAVFGPDFVVGSATLAILATMLVSNCFAQLGGYAVYMAGRSWLVTMNQAFLTVACIGLSWPLVQKWGIEGAAIGRAVGWAAWAGLILVETKLLFGFQPFTRDMLKGVVAGAVSFGVVWSLHQVPFVRDHVVPLILSGVLFVWLYGFLCLRMGLTEDENWVLRKLGAKMGRKFLRKRRPDEPGKAA